MCLELVANTISKIFTYNKVGHIMRVPPKLKLKEFFSIVRIPTLILKCCFLIKNLKKFVFVNENQPSYLCISCCKFLTWKIHVTKHMTRWKKLRLNLMMEWNMRSLKKFCDVIHLRHYPTKVKHVLIFY